MKTTIRFPQLRPAVATSFCRISLIAIMMLFCFKTGVSAGIKHLNNKDAYHGTTVENGGDGHKYPSVKKIKKSNLVTFPTISYSGPQTYLAGTAITPLAPTSTGVSAAGYSSSAIVLGSGFSIPTSDAIDKTGNVYVADGGNNAVKMIPAGGGSPVIIGSGLSNPTGVALDAAGNLYIADYGHNTIREIPAGSTTMESLGSGFNHPYSLAVDAAGNVFVADIGSNAIKEILQGQIVPVTLGSGFIAPQGVAVDAAGNVYVADTGNGVVKEIPLGTGAPVIIGSGFNNPTGVATDASGNLFIADAGNNAVKELFAGGNTPITVGPVFNSPAGVAVDALGNIYVADQLNSAVKEINPIGGYYINSLLPAGLSFSNSTGVISGTPTRQTAVTNYTIIAYNGNASASATLSIMVNALTINYGAAQTVIAGSAITPIKPVSVGVAPPAYSNNFAAIGSGFNHPFAVALDAHGNTFIADGDNYDVKEIQKGSISPVTVYPGDGTITGVAVDQSGNIFASGASNLTAIEKVPFGGGAAVAVGSGFNLPYGVATDQKGNVFVTDGGNGAIKEIPANTNAPVTIATGFNSPTSITLDAYGNIFVADENNNAIKELPVNGGAPIVLGSGFLLPTGVAVDNSGNVFVADYNNNAVKEIPAGGGNPITLSGGFSNPVGVTVDGADNLYVSDYGHNLVKEIAPAGGYYINPALPPGLVFNTTTGAITGTPVAQSLATNYTINAYNAVGSNSATIIIKVNLPALPVISYNSPQNYITGTTITPLTPTGNGVAAEAYSSSFVSIGSGFTHPFGVAVDAVGNVFIGDQSSSTIQELPVGGGQPLLLGSGFISPSGVAVDASGNIYVADVSSNLVSEIPFGGGPQVTLGSGFNQPCGVAVDAKSNVYVTDRGNNSVKMVPAGNGTPVTLATGFNFPYGLALDATGNIYVTDTQNNAIKEIPAGGGPPVTILSGLGYPTAVTVDAAGNLYVTGSTNTAVIVKIPAGGGAPVTLATTSNVENGIAIDALGDLYVSNIFVPSVVQIKPIGGYFISPVLPVGLHFDSNTGIISGTPTVFTPAKNYKVTAYNLGGGNSATINIKVSALPISYSSPQSYTLNTAISPLYPTSGGVAVAGYGSGTVTFATNFNSAIGIAEDAAGNIYVSDAGTQTIDKIPAGGGAATVVASGFASPGGIALDAAGNIYVADIDNNNVKKILAGTNTPVVIGGGFISPTGVAVDVAGNVYVADNGNNAVKKILAGSNTTITIGSGFSQPYGVCLDVAGNVYVADAANNAIKMIPAGGGATVTIATGFHNPTGVAIDASGNIFVADQANNKVKEIVGGTGTPIIIGSGFSSPYGVLIDGAGVVYVTDNFNSAVKQIIPTGGYYINALPAGLSFSNSTGGFSGKPTAISPATNYTVTAYNGSGSGSAIVNIKVLATADASLANLKISNGTLSPVFVTGTASYTASVINTVTTVTLTPTTNDAAATVKVNGTAVVSGSASTPVSLNVGANTITTVVTGSDGVTTQTYTVTVTRGQSTNALLASISLTPVSTLVGATGPGYLNFTSAVPSTEASVQVIPTAKDPTATIKVNGTTVASGTASQAIALNTGANTITTVLTAQDGVTTKTVIVTVNRAAPTGANLGGLALSNASLTPVFAAATLGYTANVANAINTITVTPTANDGTSTIKVNGTTVASGIASAAIPLNVGSNTITTVVTDGTFSKTYTVTVTRAASSNANLSNFAINSGTLAPIFSATTTGYTASVPNAVNTIAITPTTADATATVTVNGAIVASGTASASIPLAVGTTFITAKVTAQDGVTTKTYGVTIARGGPSTNALFTSISLNPVATLVGTTGPAYLNFTSAVPNSETSVQVIPAAKDATATITVNGQPVTSGTASQPIALAVGSNTITTVITAQDGITTKNCTIIVTRPQSSNDNLSNLTLSSGVLTPAFATATTVYTQNVPNTISSVTVTPTTSDATATVTVNGMAVPPGTASPAIPLVVGQNIITTKVTAQNGATKIYTVTITRAVSSNANLASLGISSGAIAPVFSAATTGYTASVPYATASVTMTATTSDATATVTVNGTTIASGTPSASIPLTTGTNVITAKVIAQDGVTTKTYGVTITRAGPSANALIASISLTPVSTLVGATGPGYLNFTAAAANSEASVQVITTAKDPTATIKVNGITATSGMASQVMALNVGANTITTVITAQDGVTNKTVIITVNRAAPPAGDSFYEPVSVIEPNDNVLIENDGVVVHQGLSPNGDGINDYLTIDNIANYPDNRLMVMNGNGVLVFDAKGYDNATKVFDGHSNKTGAMQLPGTYFYQLDYAVNGQSKRKTGFIVLKY